MAVELEESGLNLSRFKRVVRTYSELLRSPRPADAGRFLVKLKELRDRQATNENSGLAETLMLFQERLKNPGAKDVKEAFLHYVINTVPPFPMGIEDERVLKDLRKSYANSILIAPNWSHRGQPVTSLGDLREFGRAANRLRYGRPDMVPIDRIPFDPTATNYSDRNAVWMAQMSHLVYRVGERYPGDEKSEVTGRLVERQLKQWGYKSTLIESAKTDTRVFLAERDDPLAAEGRFASHGAYEYLFKLACVVKEKHFWRNERNPVRE